MKDTSYNLDYGVIGNCRAAALVSKRGSIDWLCFPDFDSPSLFAALLDKGKGGSLGFILPGGSTSTQSYLGETNILRTEFTTPDGVFEVLDFMPRYIVSSTEGHLPPEVYRIIRPLSGAPKFGILYDPVINYARSQAEHKVLNGYIRSASVSDDNDNVYLYSSISGETILESGEVVLEREEFILLS